MSDLRSSDPAGSGGGVDARASLRQALTFHASFDSGPDADLALGDPVFYSAATGGETTPGLGDPPLALAAGRFGGALEFTRDRSHVGLYRAQGNVAYSPESFNGTISFWISVDPNEIPGQYCDPVQLTDKDYDDSCIWLDITKNDTPSDLRLGVFGQRSEWDVTGQSGKSEQFFWRLAKVAEPPFAKERWTHVAVTWDGLNDSRSGRARLYLDGEARGATGVIPERFVWDPARANIRLGTGHFVGKLDDFAVFNRPLSLEEIRSVYRLAGGIADLR